jgi:hypothetical protein
MSDVDELFQLLSAAPPRSLELVRRFALEGMPLEMLAGLYDVSPDEAKVLVFRALLDVESGGTRRVSDADEPGALQAMDASPLLARLRGNREELLLRLREAAVAFANSPDRARDEWLRRIAIVLVLALTAFFYWRDENKPRPPPERRPSTPAVVAP